MRVIRVEVDFHASTAGPLFECTLQRGGQAQVVQGYGPQPVR
jgi:hypothetical protein